MGTVLLSLIFLYQHTKKETAPQEDQGFFMAMGTAPQSSTLRYIEKFNPPLVSIFKSFPETKDFFINNSSTSLFAGLILKPWDQRKRTQQAISGLLQAKLTHITGLKIFAYPPPSLPGGGQSAAVQFVLTTLGGLPSLVSSCPEISECSSKKWFYLCLYKILCNLINHKQL